MKIRIGTRGSRLALWQAENAQRQLAAKGLNTEIVVIKTKGDQIQDLGFDKMEGKGFFTKEIEEALLNNGIDLAVHSLKDLPTESLEELVIAGLSEREDPSDMLIIQPDCVDELRPLKLAAGAKVGTSSIRRKSLLRHMDSSLKIADIRGNVPTRVNKLKKGLFDAIVLAAAGIERLQLEMSGLHTVKLNPIEFVPAPGQGVIAYQCRRSDLGIRRAIQQIHHTDVARCTNVERQILRIMEGGCQLPLGAYCYMDEKGNFHCTASFLKPNAQVMKFASISQTTFSGLAERLVEKLTTES